MSFKQFQMAVESRFYWMAQNHRLFRTAVGKDELWDTYISAFPEGSNPVYRVRTQHDCSCCRQFIRALGDVVAIVGNELVSIWDLSIPNLPAYQAVADRMSVRVKSRRVCDIFLSDTYHPNKAFNFEEIIGGAPLRFDHLFARVPDSFVVRDSRRIPSLLATPRETRGVLERGLEELKMEALDTVLELLEEGSLYRGEERSDVLRAFKKLKAEYSSLSPEDRYNWTWIAATSHSEAICRLRNSAIGTLLVELSDGAELEPAVARYEAKVAPTNYRRPRALVTPAMVNRAKETLEKAGLIASLQRRHAVMEDVKISNLIYVNRNVHVMGDIFSGVSNKPQAIPKDLQKVSVDAFIRDILTCAESVEVLFEGRHQSNLVSLVAPEHPTSKSLFAWDNPFSWSYRGEVADAIKERVRKAGGSVTGDLLCRLAWENSDDLDLHMVEPSGHEIYFEARKSSSGGQLDVDMNAWDIDPNPVENIFYGDRKTMPNGVYTLIVHNFRQRETRNPGFTVQVEFDGQVYQFSGQLRDREEEKVVRIQKKDDQFTLIGEGAQVLDRKEEIWGLSTGTFHPVTSAMVSPNYWGGQGIGNRHLMFMLKGCVNTDSARGYYNEFLHPDLAEHRKVMEVLGSKLTLQPADHQLSGLGFSSTARNSAIFRINGSRMFEVLF